MYPRLAHLLTARLCPHPAVLVHHPLPALPYRPHQVLRLACLHPVRLAHPLHPISRLQMCRCVSKRVRPLTARPSAHPHRFPHPAVSHLRLARLLHRVSHRVRVRLRLYPHRVRHLLASARHRVPAPPCHRPLLPAHQFRLRPAEVRVPAHLCLPHLLPVLANLHLAVNLHRLVRACRLHPAQAQACRPLVVLHRASPPHHRLVRHCLRPAVHLHRLAHLSAHPLRHHRA